MALFCAGKNAGKQGQLAISKYTKLITIEKGKIVRNPNSKSRAAVLEMSVSELLKRMCVPSLALE